MPLKAMTEAEIAGWVDKMDPGLLLQLQRSGVTAHTIAVLANSRFTSVQKFQMLADDPAGVERVAKILGLDAKDDAAGRGPTKSRDQSPRARGSDEKIGIYEHASCI